MYAKAKLPQTTTTTTTTATATTTTTTTTAAATAASTFICVNSLVGFIARFKSGTFNPDFILPLIGFVAVGGFLGSYYGSKKYDAKKIQKVMGGIIIVAIILLTRKML